MLCNVIDYHKGHDNTWFWVNFLRKNDRPLRKLLGLIILLALFLLESCLPCGKNRESVVPESFESFPCFESKIQQFWRRDVEDI